MNSQDSVDLVDYRRRVFAQYSAVRDNPDPDDAWRRWRTARDRLFATHPQTPLDPADRHYDHQTPFAPYDPAFRVVSAIQTYDGEATDVGHGDGSTTSFVPVGRVSASLPPGDIRLTLFWLSGYGGGLFLPFRDATSGVTSYGGGRYLLDTVKGADLGTEGGNLVLDFNFAYHPSCVYSGRWSCPLAPPENHLAIPIPVGERLS